MVLARIRRNSTSALVHNSNIETYYGESTFFGGAFTNISIMALIVRRLTEMRNVHYDENDE